MNKKIIYIVLFFIALAGVVALIFGLNNATEKRDTIANTTNLGGKTSSNTSTNLASSNSIPDDNTTDNSNTKKTTVTRLEDGTLYSITDEEIKPDIVIGDNLFDTQLSDINLNFTQYEGKIIEIEGFYLENRPEPSILYTFIGRYSNSNLCQYCPQGYSYFEYEWHGDESPTLTNEQGWMKIVGKLTKGEDSYGPYYYIDASSIEIMDVRGLLTVNN